MKCSPVLALLALTPMLACCASPTAKVALTPTKTDSGATSPMVPCSALTIVHLSHADTELTKQQAIGNNAVIVAVCGPNSL